MIFRGGKWLPDPHGIQSMPSLQQITFWDKGFADLAKRFGPIPQSLIQNVNFALEVHPTEIAFDIASERALAVLKDTNDLVSIMTLPSWLPRGGLCEVHSYFSENVSIMHT